MSRHGARLIAVRFRTPFWTRRVWSGAQHFGVNGLHKPEFQFLWQRTTVSLDFATLSPQGTRTLTPKWLVRLRQFMFCPSIAAREQAGCFAIALWPKPGSVAMWLSRFGFWHRMVAQDVFMKRWGSALTKLQRRKKRQMEASCMRFVFADEWLNTSLMPAGVGPFSSAARFTSRVTGGPASDRWIDLSRGMLSQSCDSAPCYAVLLLPVDAAAGGDCFEVGGGTQINCAQSS